MYDFGDSWEHAITVHRVWRMPKGLKFAVCLDGANACPPEDVGGSWGYEHLLAVLADPTHEEYATSAVVQIAEFPKRRNSGK